MEPIRYRPGEAIRWLKTGAQTIRKTANERGRQVVQGGPPRDLKHAGRTVMDAAGALKDLGKSAWADMRANELEATEYVLLDQSFDIVKGGSIKSIPYSTVKEIEMRGERAMLLLDKGNLVIKPHAYLVSGSIKVPVGWSRNGMEVPYELLIEELAARCGVNIDTL
jgi:hypothetical protein